MTIDYDHAANLHTIEGPAIALSAVLNSDIPKSLLDVGCGTGTWMRAATDLGIADLAGVDGVALPQDALHVPKSGILLRDLSVPFDLGRRFDTALCLEVAEHLPAASAAGLISSIVRHSDTVFFSAACPGQPGQHHVNCQWPVYWQELFNRQSFACDDSVRWRVWDMAGIEPWYRQNIFRARRKPRTAGKEPRIRSVVHPEMAAIMCALAPRRSIEEGSQPLFWYLATTARVAAAKLAHRLGPTRN
jgi:SAM-dependent methyltransferase